MSTPEPETYQYIPPRGADVGLVQVGERLTALGDRLNEHVQRDQLFKNKMMEDHARVCSALKAIEVNMASWRGTAMAAVLGVSMVWAVVVVLIQVWKG